LKKIAPLLLIIVFLANLEGAYFLFLIQQSNNRKDINAAIHRNISDELLTLIVIPLEDISRIQWTRAGTEFVHDGEIFDVVRTRISDGHQYFYCINDKKEKQLIAAYQKKCEQNKSRKNLRTVNGPVFLYSCFSFSIPLPINFYDYNSFTLNYKSIINNILSPPPRQITLS